MSSTQRKPVEHLAILKADANGVYPTEIEVCHTGEWHTPWHGDFVITTEDIDQGVEQFNAGIYRVQGTEPLPGTLDHLGGESPAAFRINRVYRADDRMMASVTWTTLGKEKLDRDEYRYVSFEFWPRSMPFENPEKAGDMWVNVLAGATLTNDPLMKKLKPVMASVKGEGDNHNEGAGMNLADIRVKALADLTEDEKKHLVEHQTELTDEERTKFELVDADADAKAKADREAKEKADKEAADKAAADKAAAEKAEQDKLEAATKGMTKEQKALITGLQASVDGLKAKAEAGERAERELLKTRLTASVRAHVDRGAIKSAELDSTVDMLLASSEDARKNQLGFMDKLPDNKLLAKAEGSRKEDADSVEVTAEEREMAEAFGNSIEDVEAYKKSQR